MGRRRKKQNYEERFIVEGEEQFTINGEELTLTDAEHVIIDGREYVDIGGELYRIGTAEFGDPVPSAPERRGAGPGSILAGIFYIIVFVVCGIVAFSFFTGFVSGISAESEGASDFVADPTSTIRTTSTPIPTPTSSYEEQRARQFKEAMDYSNPTTRDFAVSLIDNAHGGEYNIAQICDMWESVNSRWTYVNDPQGVDYVSPASRTIRIGLKGDCDDFATLVASLILATGGNSRIISAHNDHVGHAYAEVFMTRDKEMLQNHINYIARRYHCTVVYYHTRLRNDGTREYWLNLDWQARYPGGPFFDSTGTAIAYYPNGYYERYATS